MSTTRLNNRPLTDTKFYTDVAKGYELKLLNLCKKYKMTDVEIERVQQIIADIEQTTQKITVSRLKDEAYRRKYRL